MEIKKGPDVFSYNSEAWDMEVANGNPWTRPVSTQDIAKAREGDFRIFLTATKPVPGEWLQSVSGKDILCLASGGGQQGPLLAAAGARVTVLDASRKQLEQDLAVAAREGLALATQQGDMRDLSRFGEAAFDLIVHPVSNCFIQDVRPVWREAFRVLRPGGSLLSGFNNPLVYSFDTKLADQGIFQMKYPIPYSDLTSISADERQKLLDQKAPLEFGHSFEDQLGGQTAAGFLLAGVYEDVWGSRPAHDRLYSSFMATRAIKPR